MPLNTPEQAISSSMEAALSRVSLLNRLIPELKQQLAAERANPPACQESIEVEIAQAQIELDKLEAKLTKEKKATKKRKKEIDDWKTWYNSNPHIDKSEALVKLEVEISWRSQEIADHETTIAALEVAKLDAMGELEKRKLQLDAFLEGFYELPVDADPRLIEANAALAAARAELKALQATDKSV